MDETDRRPPETPSAELVFARLEELRALLRLTAYLSGFRVVEPAEPSADHSQDVVEHP